MIPEEVIYNENFWIIGKPHQISGRCVIYAENSFPAGLLANYITSTPIKPVLKSESENLRHRQGIVTDLLAFDDNFVGDVIYAGRYLWPFKGPLGLWKGVNLEKFMKCYIRLLNAKKELDMDCVKSTHEENLERLESIIVQHEQNYKIGDSKAIQGYILAQSKLRVMAYYVGRHLPFKDELDVFMEDLKEGNNKRIKLRMELFRAIVTEDYKRAQRVKNDLNKMNPKKSEGEEF